MGAKCILFFQEAWHGWRVENVKLSEYNFFCIIVCQYALGCDEGIKKFPILIMRKSRTQMLVKMAPLFLVFF